MGDYDAEITFLLEQMEGHANSLDALDVGLTAVADQARTMARDEGFSRVHRGQLSIIAHKAYKAAKLSGDTAQEARDKVAEVTASLEADRWREVRDGLYQVLDEQLVELLDP